MASTYASQRDGYSPLHQRKQAPSAPAAPSKRSDDKQEDPRGRASYNVFSKALDEDQTEKFLPDALLYLGIFAISAALRFYKIDHPNSVVFDEVHFGKFASYYLRREFFFDVHPPLAKLILAFAGWVIGYDGHFEFDNIGDSYIENKVPYIGLRTLPALLGSLVPVVVYGIMRESGYPKIAAILSAALVTFDNAHVTQARFILLDSPLILFMTLSLYSYIRFYKLRYHEFSRPWWGWMCATGTFLALTISCKMVGLFAFLTIGTAVLVDLWNLLDIKRGLSMDHFARHFAARAVGLIILPATIYLFWFWVHFAILIKSGTGDEFMSPSFQETLLGSPLTLNAQEIRYYDALEIQHKNTKVLLHSHVDRYPLRYDDGRISSAGQQVTGYPFNDTNNHWVVIPTKELPETGRGRLVRHHDIIKLLHVNTDTFLLTHDVASTLMPTNTEFTTWPRDDLTRENDTLFELDIDGAHEGQQWKSKSAHFKLIHVPTRVAMWTHTDKPLPEWAFKQQEINGNKNINDKSNLWVVDEIIKDPNATATPSDTPTPPPPAVKPVKKVNFFIKFFELQIAMLQHNAGLTDHHPYATTAINWPFLLSGISFWTGQSELKQQVYMIGNAVSWWGCVMAISIFIGIWGADQLARRRGIEPIPDIVRTRLHNSAGFFVIAWVFHYFPFFLMARQTFLHHYLPAHVISALVTGAVFNFVITETINYPVSVASAATRRRPRTVAEIPKGAYASAAVFIALLAGIYAFMAPLVYGYPGLEPEEVNRRRFLATWTMHYAK